MPSLPPFLSARPTFRNHMTQKSKGKTGHTLSGSKSRTCLSKLYRHEFMGPDEMHSSDEKAGRCHCQATLNCWLAMVTGKVPKDGRKTNVIPIFKQ